MGLPFGLLKKLAAPLVKKAVGGVAGSVANKVEAKVGGWTGIATPKPPRKLIGVPVQWALAGIGTALIICLVGLALGVWTIADFITLFHALVAVLPTE